ncbi:class I SAM-dependent methyltransferase [Mesobacillus subterraneus]|uniref:Class I SAM-dependent methyltransferase n=1 Tax=Mesobacillus subterraneus TaxID=285983 RepID=A0A3R9DRE1_9BACI|nr:class I SAM-dependent methyltransferase [Mesobacillus subterraneus]RSD25542.1 class I SAM-dependent methyltransferase [Mesobacillus subterraneus]
MKETIYSYEDLLNMLDHLLEEERQFNWNDFYSDRGRKVPFFRNLPDENLVSYFESEKLKPGRVLEFGCGPGRNAIYLSKIGFTVDAVDQSAEGLRWGKDRANKQNVQVNFIESNIFDLSLEENAYDLVYDSGCFHHIPPHRRMNYIELVFRALKPGGHFALTCFVEGGELGGASMSDWDVYRERSMRGGLGFTEKKLRETFNGLEAMEIRKMIEKTPDQGVFGTSALMAALFRKK